MPRWRLPDLKARRSRTGEGAERSRSRFPLLKSLLVGAALLLAGFVVGLLLAFPREALRERVELLLAERTPLTAEIDHLSLSFPAGLVARDLRLLTPLDIWPEIRISALKVEPLWGSLFDDKRGIAFRAELPEGLVEGEARQGGGLEAEIRQLPITLADLGPTSLGCIGLLREGSFRGVLPVREETETRLRLDLEQLRVTGLEALGAARSDLNLGTLTLQAAGQGRRLQVEQLSANGGELEASVDGFLVLGDSPASTRINFTVQLQPRPGFPPELAELLNLAVQPRPDGTYRFRLTGSLARPTAR